MKGLYMRFPNGLAKCLTLSYDDGVEQDIRLVELMKQHGIAGTFNINSGAFAKDGKVYEKGTIHRRMSLKGCLDTFKGSKLIEVATHGYTHPHLERIPSSEAVWQIIADRRELEKQFGGIIRGHAYAYGTYNNDCIEVLKSCGIVYARTIHSTLKFDMPENWLTLHPTCHHADDKLIELTDNFLSMDVKNAPRLFYVWGHSYEFERDNNWDVIEKFFDKISGKSDIWYATNIEIYEYTKAYESLIYSADGETVFNPTVTDVWVQKFKDETTHIPAGQTVKLL